MRELNPRAWIPSLNRYATGNDAIYYHCQINHENGEWWCYPDDKIIQLDVEIELPTGLKDKNGKEIYEGDIIHRGALSKANVFRNSVIRFDEESVGFIATSTRNGARTLFNGHTCDEIEVIGNIHENPELLEDKK